jgi:ATP-binding cassette subfamily F protein uup
VVLGDRTIHVAGWAKKFLFQSDQLETPVGRLSGGEQARVMIARLMLEPADVLFLDEPTNDLDIPTLEVLEESLLEFKGALVLVTHDRYLLDRVSTRLLALDGEGGAQFYSDYAQWELGRQAEAQAGRGRTAASAKTESVRPAGKAAARRLSYHEQREYEQMEALILEAEAGLEACQQAAADPAVASDHQALAARHKALAAAEVRVAQLYSRWADLEAKTRV